MATPRSAVQVAPGGVEGEQAAGVATHISTGGFASTNVKRCKQMAKRDLGAEIEVVTVDEWGGRD